MVWITLEALLRGIHPVRIEDVWYGPLQPTPSDAQMLFDEDALAILPGSAAWDWGTFDKLGVCLQPLPVHSRSSLVWVHVLPPSRAGLWLVILEGGLTEQTVRAFGLHRLSGIRQLAFLRDPVVAQVATNMNGWEFRHSRYVHVLEVMAILTLMLQNNGVTGSAFRDARVAALIHDALTPAGGDATKRLDPAGFDEDACIAELFASDEPSGWRNHTVREEWHLLRRQYGLSRRRITNMIQGRGPFGPLLAFADRLAYVSRDVDAFMTGSLNGYPTPSGYARILKLLDAHPLPCTVWDATVFRNDRMYVTDPDRLGAFLLLRALLFSQLYCAPEAQRIELGVALPILSFLYGTGRLTRQDLLRMQDYDLENRMEEVTGCSWILDLAASYVIPKMEIYRSPEHAKMRVRELVRMGFPFAWDISLARTANPATDMLVRHRGRILPFREARPEAAAEIEAAACIPDPHRVFWLDDTSFFDEDFVRELRDFRRTQFAAP